MDEVLRQDDPEFLNFLDNLRQGTVCHNDVSFIYNHWTRWMKTTDNSFLELQFI